MDTTRALPIGINFDGVLEHDGLPTTSPAERFRWIQRSGAFDYIEKNIDPSEDVAPYVDLVAEHEVPIRVFGGIFRAGRDEAVLREGIATGGRLGARVFNMQLFARHEDGHELRDDEVARWFLDAMERGSRVGCLPSFEVHVDMWNERFARVEDVANLLARRHVPMRLTLDHSHLLFKIGDPAELALSGLATAPDGARELLAPDGRHTLYRRWLDEGWVAHAHARSVAPGVACNAAMARRPGVAGRAIQYPFVAPAPGSFHAEPWAAERVDAWKQAVRQLLACMRRRPEATPGAITCEFLPFADYGGGGRYSIWDNNLACAAWLRDEWQAARASPADPGAGDQSWASTS